MEANHDRPVARVVVDVPTRALAEPFDYAVPDALAAGARVGAPVLVALSGQRVVGYVVSRETASSYAGALKPLEAVLGEPLFGPEAFALAQWMSSEYVCALADALRLFLPPGGSPSAIARYAPGAGAPRSGRRAQVHQAVCEAGELSFEELRRLGRDAPGVAADLARAGMLVRSWRLKPAAVGAVDDRWVELAPDSGFAPRAGAAVQRAVLDALSAGPVRVPELSAELGDVSGAVRRLDEAGAVVVTRRRRMRDPHAPVRAALRPERLTPGQSDALGAIRAASPGEVVVLDGVTGSGKTEVYLQALESVLAEGRGAIVLVPEISLTPQTVGRFRSRFGDLVAVLHSNLAPGERYDQWDRARGGECRVVVGPRSALFAPVAGLGMVVIDEEHESSYKQGSAPRYHARAVAERLCASAGAVLVLGSATPSFETRVACDTGRYRRVALPERVGGALMPAVTVVDMAAEFKAGHRSMFSRPLLSALEGAWERREKSVLFLNRRGFASFLLCRECGLVPQCASCSVALTYHEVGGKLVCHHCGQSAPVPSRCPRCGSPYLRQFGAGTQRVESELASVLPDTPIVRMDADTARGKGVHERLLAQFEATEGAILLGTQMIAKGLDYPDVTVVGVVNADTTLNLPDFRAAERTYQLLEQVSGRAGRGERPGNVFVQTYWPDHAAVRAAAAHDPEILYGPESVEREALGYPPFGRLANVTVTGPVSDAVRGVTAALADGLRDSAPPGWSVLGPSPAVLARIKGRYRWHVLVKCPSDAVPGPVIAGVLADLPAVDGVSVAPDVDPTDML